MSLFKFRFPGQNSAGAAADVAPSAASESVEVLRRRARHRLLGAVVLVFVAVVAFPLLFDAQPRPVPVNTPIVIGERSTTPALNSNVPMDPSQRPSAPLLTASPVASAPALAPAASVEPGHEQVLSATVAANTEQKSAALAPTAGEDKVEKKTDNKTDKGSTPAERATDVKTPTKAPAKTEASDEGVWVIQAGAYAEADKLREVIRKLETAGLKTYTQVVESKDGKRSTRVRIGPFGSRGEADKVAARVRKLNLSAQILAL